MTNQRYAFSWVLTLLLPVTFSLGCGVVRDWSVCVPEDKQPCLDGYVCTADLRCVRRSDGGVDALVSVDSQVPTDVVGASVDLALPDAVGTSVDLAPPVVSDGPASPGPDAAAVPPAVDAAPDVPQAPDAATDLPIGSGGASG
ncbi:MAG: hypothetical protein WCG85_18905, partial [Polyangia bacterium]